jgi:hypothetical protein
METRAQSVPATTTKKRNKKDPIKLIMTPSGYAAKGRAKKLPPRLGGI